MGCKAFVFWVARYSSFGLQGIRRLDCKAFVVWVARHSSFGLQGIRGLGCKANDNAIAMDCVIAL